MESTAAERSGDTVVAESTFVVALLWIGFPVVGAGAGWLLKLVAGWVAALPWAPLQGPFKLISSISEPQATIGALTVGALGGLAVAYIAAQENLTVTVSADRITMVRGGKTQAIDPASVRVVFLDGKQLVLLGQDTRELAREQSDLDGDALADAFRGRGFAWSAEGDPHKDDYRRWVPDLPDLPVGANALFKARELALEKGNKDDVTELRGELAKLGVVVRDEKKRQYWRRAG
jgi:hypothetical protein